MPDSTDHEHDAAGADDRWIYNVPLYNPSGFVVRSVGLVAHYNADDAASRIAAIQCELDDRGARDNGWIFDDTVYVSAWNANDERRIINDWRDTAVEHVFAHL